MISTSELPSLAVILRDLEAATAAATLTTLAATATSSTTSLRATSPEHAICGKCKQLKHVTEFYKDNRYGRTHSCYCKVCSIATSAASKKRRKLFQGKEYKFHLGKGDK